VADKTNVTRIKAKDETKPATKPAKKTTVKAKKVKTPSDKPARRSKNNVLRRIGAYFKGAWAELRLVRWPNRRATWQLTVAVILFSLFFLALIVLLDTLFKYLFELIIT